MLKMWKYGYRMDAQSGFDPDVSNFRNYIRDEFWRLQMGSLSVVDGFETNS